MVDLRFMKKQLSMLMIAYGFFCVAVVSVFAWAGSFLYNEVNAEESLSLFSIIFMVRWCVLFLIGLPFIAVLGKRQIDQQKLVGTDDITGLYNHRQLLETLDRELMRARRYAQEFSVMMIDVDNFKTVNDSYGHLAGGQVLQEIGSILARDTREVDIAGRFGEGTSFLLFCRIQLMERLSALLGDYGATFIGTLLSLKGKSSMFRSVLGFLPFGIWEKRQMDFSSFIKRIKPCAMLKAQNI